MPNRVFSLALVLILFTLGMGIFNGGFYSRKHGMFLSAGAYNEEIGIGLIILAAYFLYLGFFRKMPKRED